MQKITDWQTSPRGKIGIASDHGGFELKKQITAFLAETGFEPVDFGPFTLDPADDYPDFLVLRRKLIAKRLKEYYFSL